MAFVNETGRKASISLAIAFGAVVWLGLPATSTATTGIVVEKVKESPAATKAYWTAAELAEAAANGSPGAQTPSSSSPAPGLRSDLPADGDFTPDDPTTEPWRTHGKVVFRLGQKNFSCSGTLIDSAGRNVVATAGHCVYEPGAKTFVTNLAFIPAYDGTAVSASEREPFGTWPAKRIATTRDWRFAGQLGADIAFFTVTGEPGRRLGGRKILFGNQTTGRSVTIIGYPAEPSELFDGRQMRACRSLIADRDSGGGTIFPAAFRATPCSMGGGSSGGGWITRGGLLTSVVSYGYCPGRTDLCSSTFGPVLGASAESLYSSDAIGGSRRPSITITAGPGARVVGSTASFRIQASGSTAVSKWCRIDRRPAQRCSGTVTYRNLEAGRHTFSVRSIDQTGRQSAKLGRSFTIVRG